MELIYGKELTQEMPHLVFPRTMKHIVGNIVPEYVRVDTRLAGQLLCVVQLLARRAAPGT